MTSCCINTLLVQADLGVISNVYQSLAKVIDEKMIFMTNHPLARRKKKKDLNVSHPLLLASLFTPQTPN